MSQREVVPDDGTPLHALGELRRAIGSGFDQRTAEVVNAVERAQGSVIQADNAKTLQEEIRHLVRGLAAAIECFILAPREIQGTYRGVMERLEQQVAALVQAIPKMPTAPHEVARQVTQMAQQFDAFLSRCEEKAGRVEGGLTHDLKSLTVGLTQAAAVLRQEARATAGPRLDQGVLLLVAGVVIGVFIGAYLWKPPGTDIMGRPKAFIWSVEPSGHR